MVDEPMKIDPHSIHPGDEITVRMTAHCKAHGPAGTSVFASTSHGLEHTIPLADILTHTPKPRPFAVGEAGVKNGVGVPTEIIGIDGNWAWIKYSDGHRREYLISDLRHADET